MIATLWASSRWPMTQTMPKLRIDAPLALADLSKRVTAWPRSAADHAWANPTIPAPMIATRSLELDLVLYPIRSDDCQLTKDCRNTRPIVRTEAMKGIREKIVADPHQG